MANKEPLNVKPGHETDEKTAWDKMHFTSLEVPKKDQREFKTVLKTTIVVVLVGYTDISCSCKVA